MTTQSSVLNSTETATMSSLFSAIAGGVTLKEIQGIPDSVMEGIYAHAYKFYHLGQLDNAEVFFQFLCLYDAFNPEYKMGLAATLQQKKQYQNAINVYESMWAIAKNDYRSKLHMGQCYLFLKNKRQAREAFAAILESDASAALKEQAQAYLAMIKPVENVETIEKSEASNG